MAWWVQPVVTALSSGLVAGAAGGVLSAGAIAGRAQRGRDRYDARVRIRGVLVGYRDELRFHRANVPAVGSFPSEFAGWNGQYALAHAVLLDLEFLRPRERRAMVKDLQTLVGPSTFATAEERLHVSPDSLPEVVRDPTNSTLRANRLIVEISSDAPRGAAHALWELIHDERRLPEGRPEFDTVVKLLDQMIDRTKLWRQ